MSEANINSIMHGYFSKSRRTGTAKIIISNQENLFKSRLDQI
jgi:hypothetical protein